MTRQTAFSCGCGAPHLFRADRCRRCDRRARLNREKFAGLREAALRRDGYQCQGCGERDPALLLVHHRRPGVDLLRWLVTLCRGCHVTVHHTYRPRFGLSPFLRELWREVHRGPEQRRLDFWQSQTALQVELLDAAGVWAIPDALLGIAD